MGRIGQAAEVKKIKGTGNQTRERRKAEPTYPAEVSVINVDGEDFDIPVCPETIQDDEARGEWNRLCVQLAYMGLLPPSVLKYIESYCQALEVRDRSWEQIRGGQLWEMTDKGDTREKAAVKTYREAVSQMITIGAKFGFTPADKTKISMIANGANRKDKNQQKKIGIGG